jgi:hypothetical protein
MGVEQELTISHQLLFFIPRFFLINLTLSLLFLLPLAFIRQNEKESDLDSRLPQTTDAALPCPCQTLRLVSDYSRVLALRFALSYAMIAE